MSNNLRDTKKRFCYETIRECYGDLVYFYGCTDPIQRADDYEECYREIFNRDYPRDTDDDNSESSD